MDQNSLLILILKETVVFSFLFGFYLLFLRKEKSLYINRMALLSALALPIVIVSLNIRYEVVEVKNTPAVAPEKPIISGVVVDTSTKSEMLISPSVQQYNGEIESQQDIAGSILLIICYLYFIVLFGIVLRLIVTTIAFIVAIKKENDYRDCHGKKVVVSNRWGQSFSFFRIIVLTESDITNPVLFNHELVHVKQWHSVDLIFAELFLAFNWFNPLVYVLKREVSSLHEYIADQKSIENGVDEFAYKKLILSRVSNAVVPNFCNSFSAKQIKKRFTMLSKNTKTKLYRYSLYLSVVFILFVLFSFRVVKKVEYVDSQNQQEYLLKETFPPDDTLAEAKPTQLPRKVRESELEVLSVNDSIFESKGFQNDSAMLYERLGRVLSNEWYKLVTISQSGESEPVFNSIFVGDSVTLKIIALSIGATQPQVELKNEVDGDAIEPDNKIVTDSTSVYTYEKIEKGRYKVALLNQNELDYFLYNYSIPDEQMGAVDFGLTILGKDVLLSRVGKDENTNIEVKVGNKKRGFELDSLKIDSVTVSGEKIGVNGMEAKLNVGNPGEIDAVSIVIKYEPYNKQIEKEKIKISESNINRIADTEGEWPRKYLQESIVYPPSYKPKRKQVDVVEVEFWISEEGKISEVKVLQGVTPELDSEIVKAVKSMSDWIPEKPMGIPSPARVKYKFGLGKK